MKKTKDKSIREKVQIFCVGTIIITSILCFFSVYIYFYNQIFENTKNISEQSLKFIGNNVENLIYQMEDLSYSILGNAVVQSNLLNLSGEDEYQRQMSINRLDEVLDVNYGAYEAIKSIAFVSGDTFLCMGYGNDTANEAFQNTILESEVLEKAENANGKMVIYIEENGDVEDNSFESSVYFVRLIKNIYNNKTKLGYIIIELPSSKIEEIYEQEYGNAEASLFILNEDDTIVSGINNILDDDQIKQINDFSEESIIRINGEKVFFDSRGFYEDTWQVAVIVPYHYYFSSYYSQLLVPVIISLFSILIASVMSIYFAEQITIPLEMLKKKVENFGQKGFHVVLEEELQENNEIGKLAYSFKEMSQTIENLITDIVREQNLKKDYMFQVLQYQINPHFFYNTLDSICWFAKDSGDEKIVTIVTAMSKLFRISLSKGDETILIKEEIEHLKSYLQIVEIRFEDQFEYSLDFTEEILEYKTVKLILQPLIENAINHGIKMSNRYGILDIKGYEKDNDIYFIVEDNGTGIEEERLEELISYIQLPPLQQVEKKCGFGLRNINARIQMKYGTNYGLELKNRTSGTGVIAIVKIPKTLL